MAQDYRVRIVVEAVDKATGRLGVVAGKLGRRRRELARGFEGGAGAAGGFEVAVEEAGGAVGDLERDVGRGLRGFEGEAEVAFAGASASAGGFGRAVGEAVGGAVGVVDRFAEACERAAAAADRVKWQAVFGSRPGVTRGMGEAARWRGMGARGASWLARGLVPVGAVLGLVDLVRMYREGGAGAIGREALQGLSGRYLGGGAAFGRGGQVPGMGAAEWEALVTGRPVAGGGGVARGGWGGGGRVAVTGMEAVTGRELELERRRAGVATGATAAEDAAALERARAAGGLSEAEVAAYARALGFGRMSDEQLAAFGVRMQREGAAAVVRAAWGQEATARGWAGRRAREAGGVARVGETPFVWEGAAGRAGRERGQVEGGGAAPVARYTGGWRAGPGGVVGNRFSTMTLAELGRVMARGGVGGGEVGLWGAAWKAAGGTSALFGELVLGARRPLGRPAPPPPRSEGAAERAAGRAGFERWLQRGSGEEEEVEGEGVVSGRAAPWGRRRAGARVVVAEPVSRTLRIEVGGTVRFPELEGAALSEEQVRGIVGETIREVMAGARMGL